MRALLLSACLLAPLSAQVPKSYAVNTGWAPKQDKQLHFLAGAAIALPVYQLSAWIGNNDPIWDVIFWVTLAALWKENYDRHHGGRPDYADAAYTYAGAGFTVFMLRWNDHRKQEFAGIPPGALLYQEPRPAISGPCCAEDPQ